MSLPPMLAKLEALLFLAGEALSKADLARQLDVPATQLDSFLEQVSAALAGHGLTIVTTATHAQLSTSETVSDFVAAYLHDASRQLSAAAAEVLAIIAYQGPITRLDLNAIRGVDSRRTLSVLLTRGLIARRGERHAQYEITPSFLQHLGVTRREQLPNFAELSDPQKLSALRQDSVKLDPSDAAAVESSS